MKKNKKLIKEVFSLIGEELSKLDETCIRPDDSDKTIEFNITAKNFRKDGFDLVWNHNGLEVGDSIMLDIVNKRIRGTENIWFDSGFDKNGYELNLDWSLQKGK